VIATGVVVNPARVIEELDELAKRGAGHADNLRMSDRAHVIFPWHFAEDRALDKSTSDGENIGTTGRGIGPCYRDKVGRSHAIRLGDLYLPTFRGHVEHIVAAKNRILEVLYPAGEFQPLEAGAIVKEYEGYAERLRPYVCDTTELLLSAAESGKRILFEGAQGALLDVDHGTYPFVTSSSSSGVGIASGSGVPAKYIDRSIGVVKAYSTRVGGGPFPTEQDNATGQYLRDRGNEYGTVTRRPRRCGWLDTIALRYTSRLSGVDEIAVMLLDVLSGLDELQVCTAYEIGGKQTSVFPSHVDDLRRAKPVYESVPGWKEEITGCRAYGELPANAKSYLARISELVGRPIGMVSVGPERDQTIVIRKSK
jgi:adenylosuccinate synthase